MDEQTVVYVRATDDAAAADEKAAEEKVPAAKVPAAKVPDETAAGEKATGMKSVRPEDPTVAAIQLPRLSSGHTVELGQLRNQVAKLLDRVSQLEEGAEPKATAAPVAPSPASPAPATSRTDPVPSSEDTTAVVVPPAQPGTPAATARPGSGPSAPARPAGVTPSAAARPGGGPSAPARPGSSPSSTPARPGSPASPPARPDSGRSTPVRPSSPPSPSARPGSGPSAPARQGSNPSSPPARPNGGSSPPARRPGNGPSSAPARPNGGSSAPARPTGGPSTPARSGQQGGRPGLPRPAETPRPAAKAAATPASASAGGDLEAGYAAVLAGVLGVATVASTSNFFDELGADSLVMARFCAKVRSRPELPNVAMKDIYRAPTIAELAAVGAKTAARPPTPDVGDTVTIKLAALRKTDVEVVENDPAMAPVATVTYLLCGFLQLLVLLGYPALISYVFAEAEEWVLTATTPLETYGRSALVDGGLFLGVALLPILAKWLLVGRWKPTQFPVYGFRYFRFWLVKTLIRTNPMVLYVGTPLYPFYLRLLGAKIGSGTTILSPTIPVCTDLLSVGAHTVVRKQSSFTGYRAQAGMIQTGPVSIGSDALVGEATVLDVFTSVGDGAQLGHTSSLHAGQSVPAGQRWHGNPAEPTSVNYRAVPPAAGGSPRKVAYTIASLVALFAVVPLGTTLLALLIHDVPQVQQLFVTLDATADGLPLAVDVLVIATIGFFGGILGALLVMATVPRLLALLVRPNKVYRTYGIAYWALGTITLLTNSTFLMRITGDSSYVVGYLRAIGYRFDHVEQTGSNFGTAVAHDSPFLCHVGSGTVVADGLTLVNTDYSHNTFAVSQAKIGAHSFLGNQIFYPSRSRVGDDCLLATKVMVPVEGPVRHGIGLLGSPSFPIPRSTDRDNRLALSAEQRSAGLAAKDRHNALSIAMLLVSRWVYVMLVVLLLRVALDLYSQFGAATFAALAVVELLLAFGYFVALDCVVRRLVALRPQGVSIYDHGFWRHERYWKVAADLYIQRLNGTPFKAGLWRALGVQVGRRLFDDGLGMTERKLVAIGDHCSFNERSLIQCHSQENDAFKSDRVVVGSGVTVGVSAFIHYGTHLGDGSIIEADSFLMKGEETESFTRWGGNPAAELGSAPQLPITSRRKS